MTQAIQDLHDRRIQLLGVGVTDVTRDRAVALIHDAIRRSSSVATSFFFVNAHTLNLAAADAKYRDILNRADYVFGDGTGVRWAARLQGHRVRDNLVGTDLVPHLLRSSRGETRSYYLLGGDEETVPLAAEYAQANFPDWNLAGFHHGFLSSDQLREAAIADINRRRPDVLLVGMGNTRQERWVHEFLHQLRVRACLAIGGLFDYWAGNVSRAPKWLRQAGHEWIWRLVQQPSDKARRYLVGNPVFLYRIFRDRLRRKPR